MQRLLLHALFALQVVALGACQSTPTEPLAGSDSERAVFEFADIDQEGVVFPIDVYDPLEPANRAIYKFNAMFDRAIFIPVVEAYEFLTPTFLRERVTNVFSNLSELSTIANSLLQGKLERASRALVRFFVNTTLGLAGLFDPMTALGTNQQKEDLGQTLGVWGVGDGPYLVLPILGPSNLRDTTGLVGDTLAYRAIDPFGLASFEQENPAILGLRAVDARYNIDFRYHETGSPFEYELVRLVYTKKRRLDIDK